MKPCTHPDGHEFEQATYSVRTRLQLEVRAYPPKYPETCKHCGLNRVATRNPEWSYSYPDD